MSNCDEKQIKTTENALFLSTLLYIDVQYLHQSLFRHFERQKKNRSIISVMFMMITE